MKLDNVKLSELTYEHVIRLIRELTLVIVLAYLWIKIFSGELSLDLTKLTASELVSLLLAFFSIALSAAFYFAATNSSNNFYDNINKFTKDTSELLGRVDEQVKSVNNRQDELRDSFNKHYGKPNTDDIVAIKAETDKKIKDAEKAWEGLLKDILNTAKLAPAEKSRLESELKNKDIELSRLREQSSRLKGKTRFNVINHTKSRIRKMGLERAASMPPRDLLFYLTHNAISAYLRDLALLGYIKNESVSSPSDVTDDGAEFITGIMERLLDSENNEI